RTARCRSRDGAAAWQRAPLSLSPRASGPVRDWIAHYERSGASGLVHVLSEHRPHRFQRTFERVENQAKNFQGHSPQESFVARFSQYDRGMAIALGQGNVALGNAALDLCAVGQGKSHFSLGLKADSLPVLFGNQGVD